MVDTYAYVTEYAPLSAGGLNAITYLLDANFGNMPDASAPLTSPLAVDVGELTLVQNDGQFSISGGELVIPAQSTPVWGDLVAYGPSVVRKAGIAYLPVMIFSSLANTQWGFDPGPAGLLGSSAEQNQATAVKVLASGGPTVQIATYSTAIEYSPILALRNEGAYHFLDSELLWVDENNQAVAPIYAAISNSNSVLMVSLLRLASLADNPTLPVPALGTRDLDLSTPGTGSGTSSIAAPSAGDAGVMTADALVTCDVSAPTGTTTVFVRYVDATNYDQFSINASGDLAYDEIVGGVLNNLITAAAVISGGERISCQVNGDNATLHYDDNLAGTTASASNNTTGTTFELDLEADAVTNLEARTLDGVANVGSSNHPGYGVATDVLPGPLAANDEATREIKTWCEVTIPTIPSAGNVEYAVRYIDTNNYVYLEIDTAGDFDLREVTGGGASTSLATNAAGISGGERLVFVDDSTGIKVYHDTTLAIDQATTLHNTATLTRVLSLGTGGQLSDAINDPQDLSNAPNTPGAANVKAAFDLMATP